MSVRNPNYQQVHDLYELCSDGRSLQEFCRMSGVSYQKYMEWLRGHKQMTTFASMIDERAYELALSQLAQAREEKMLLFEQVKRLTEEVALLRSSSSNQADQQAETTRELTAKVSELSNKVEKLNARIDHLNEVIQMKDEVIKAKDLQIKNLKNEVFFENGMQNY